MATATFNAPNPAAGSFRPTHGNGHSKTVSGTFAFDTSYPTGGESITDITGRFKTCQGIFFSPKGGYVFEADLTNNKVIAYYGDNNNAADGPLIEVPNTTNLSTLTGVQFFAWGI